MDAYEVRRLNVARLIEHKFAGRQKDFARATGISATYVSRMLKAPGEKDQKRIGEDKARQIEDVLNLPTKSLDIPPDGVSMDHPLIHLEYTVPPITIMWGDPMNEPLPAEFCVVIPEDDDSMAPDLPAGAKAWFETGLDPRAPDWVLLADDADNWYVRAYKERRPGHWEAHAVNSAHLPLDSIRDGLRVLAIYMGMKARRG